MAHWYKTYLKATSTYTIDYRSCLILKPGSSTNYKQPHYLGVTASIIKQ